MLVCLLILTVTFFILTVYSILQSNIALLHIQTTQWLSFKILDTSSSATLFVTLVGALLVRHQFALGVLPRLNYQSTTGAKSNLQNPRESFETWRVEIKNTGLGSAIVNRVEYVLEQKDATEKPHTCNFEGLINSLAKLNLTHNNDYWLDRFTSGFSLAPKDNYFVFEIRKEHTGKLKRLNMLFFFQGQLGDKYCKEISLIPKQ